MLNSGLPLASDALANAASAYMLEAFGARLDLQPLPTVSLPHFLADRYRFWRGTLFDRPLVLMAIKTQVPGQAASKDYLKHRDLVGRQLGDPLVVLLLDRATAAIRKQLVERHIAFLAPGAQLYVPEALIDLREQGMAPVSARGDQISPTAQLLVLASLLGEAIDGAHLTSLAERFHVAIMSIGRALDELETLGVAKARHVGRQRRLHFALAGGALWRAVETHLQSPVRKVRTVTGHLPDHVATLAGESALAHYTMLAAPRIERRAIPAARWKRLEQDFGLAPALAFDNARTELETWSYEPRLLAREGVVDPLSLYLSVRHDPDERVAQAAHQLLEPFEW